MVAGLRVQHYDAGHIGGLDDEAHSLPDGTLEVQR